LPIERARREQHNRYVFADDERHAVIASAEQLRDRLGARLMFDYGLRKGSLRAVQFKHFDHQRRRLTIFAKGSTVRPIPIPHPAFWMDLERLIFDVEAQPSDYLLPGSKGNQWKRTLDPSRPMSEHRTHDWWYERLEDAAIVPKGIRKGWRMHWARHTAGQRMLDATGNLKAVQMQLGHADISTTANTYVGWDEDQLAVSLAAMIEEDDEE
jgi:integrase